MHEFSIAVNMVDIAQEYAEKANAAKVNEIELDIGNLSGVVIDAMTFAMEAATKDTIFEQSKIRINQIEAKAVCDSCKHEFTIENIYDSCPKCGSYNPQIISGKELRIKSLNID